MSPLTAEKVADFLPLSGKMPHISGRIINVTHQIPYNISRSSNSVSTVVSDTPSKSKPAQKPETEEEEEEDDGVTAAPVSKVTRHHRRGRTLRAKFRAAEWMIVQNRGHGALNAGLQSLNDEYQTLHIGWTGPIKDESNKVVVPSEDLTEEDKTKLSGLLMETGHIIPIFLDSKSRGHYEGYCKEGKYYFAFNFVIFCELTYNIVLWPLFHYLVWTNDSNGLAEKQYWEDYVAVNRQFAETIAAQYRPGDISKY